MCRLNKYINGKTKIELLIISAIAKRGTKPVCYKIDWT